MLPGKFKPLSGHLAAQRSTAGSFRIADHDPCWLLARTRSIPKTPEDNLISTVGIRPLRPTSTEVGSSGGFIREGFLMPQGTDSEYGGRAGTITSVAFAVALTVVGALVLLFGSA